MHKLHSCLFKEWIFRSALLPTLAVLLHCLTPAAVVKAEVCALDSAPASTLLVPYFEVELSPENCSRGLGKGAVVLVTNASAAASLTNVVVWSAWSIPVLDFNLYLGGYDVEEIDLLQILCSGRLPGLASQFGESARSITVEELAHISESLRGKPSPRDGKCSAPTSGNKAVGYITIDAISESITGTPADGASYLAKLARTNNLLGEAYATNRQVSKLNAACGGAKKCATRVKKRILSERGIPGLNVVHIEADDGTFFQAGDTTFYGRYNGNSAIDRREPLPTSYHVRFRRTSNSNKLDLVVWRDNSLPSTAVDCQSVPAWHPLVSEEIVAFDTSMNAEGIETDGQLTNETQILANFSSLLPFEHGWAYLNLFKNSSKQAFVALRRDGAIDDTGVMPLTSACPERRLTRVP